MTNTISGLTPGNEQMYTKSHGDERVAVGGALWGGPSATRLIAVDSKIGSDPALCRSGLSLQEQVQNQQQKTRVFKPRYVCACQENRWTIGLWKKAQAKDKNFVPYRCGSWRCSARCRRAELPKGERCTCCRCRNASQWFARIKTAFDRSPENWVFATLTIDRRDWKAKKGFNAEQVAFREIEKCWKLLYARLHYLLGKVVYVMALEQHQSGWPHIHVAMQSKALASKCAGEGWRDFRRDWLKSNATECGFGYVCHIEPARNSDAIAGYIVKCAALSGELAKGAQVPVNAPRGFRRIRATKGFLPPKIKNEDISGELIFSSPGEIKQMAESLQKRCDNAQKEKTYERELQAQKLADRSPEIIDFETGEVLVDLFEKPLLKSGRVQRHQYALSGILGA